MLISNFNEKIGRELKNYKDSTIIVEGKKDRKALNKLGFKNIVEISGNSLYKIVNEVGLKNSVIVLTDFDEAGIKKASTLNKIFQGLGIEVNHRFRKKFKELFKVHKIEELNRFIKMEDDYYDKTCSIYDKIFNSSKVLNRRSSRKTRCNRRYIRSDRRTVRTGP